MQVVGDHGVESDMAVDWDNNTQETVCDGVGTLHGRGGKQGDHRDRQEALKVPVIRSVKLVRFGLSVSNSLVDVSHIGSGLASGSSSIARYKKGRVRMNKGGVGQG